MKKRMFMAMVLRNRRIRRRLARFVASLTGGGAVAGAVIAFFFDPQNGRRRRHMARDRTAAFFRRPAKRATRVARGKAILARDKAAGLTQARKSLNGASGDSEKQAPAKAAGAKPKTGNADDPAKAAKPKRDTHKAKSTAGAKA